LLSDVQRESPALRDAVLGAAGVSIERADATMRGTLRLSLSEQLRVAEAALIVAPAYQRSAQRLRAQVLAARSYESGEVVERHYGAPSDRWERTPQLRR
jgi:hypothetical protein